MENAWRKFEEVELSHSNVHHIMAVHDLLESKGYARSVDVSKSLNITRSSASITLHKLIEKQYLIEDENKFLKLTVNGKEFIKSVISKRNILIMFFKDALNMTDENAEVEACKIEHLVSKNVIEKLFTFMGYLFSQNEEALNFKSGFEDFKFKCTKIDDCEVCTEVCLYTNLKEMSKAPKIDYKK